MRRPGAWDAAIAVVVEIIAPIFGIVLIGWLAARLRAFDEAATRGLSPHPEWGLVLAYFSGAFANFALAAGIARRAWSRRGAEPAIFGITAAFSNTIILGIPIVLRAFGDVAAVPLSLIVAFHSGLIFALTTVAAEFGLGGGGPWHRVFLNIGKGLVTNPILWGIAVGLALNLLGLALPALLDQLAATLGAAALPAALFALGANLSRFRLARTLRATLLLTGLKILLQPALVGVLAAFVFALPPVSLAVAVTIAALPTGINAYLFAARYEAAVQEATSTILVSTLVSAATLAVVLAAFRS